MKTPEERELEICKRALLERHTPVDVNPGELVTPYEFPIAYYVSRCASNMFAVTELVQRDHEERIVLTPIHDVFPIANHFYKEIDAGFNGLAKFVPNVPKSDMEEYLKTTRVCELSLNEQMELFYLDNFTQGLVVKAKFYNEFKKE